MPSTIQARYNASNKDAGHFLRQQCVNLFYSDNFEQISLALKIGKVYLTCDEISITEIHQR